MKPLQTTVETLFAHDGSPYLTRVIVGRLRFHVFHRGDIDPDPHDHPADFWTFPLVPYVEQYLTRDGRTGRRVVRAFRLHHRRAEFAHRVVGRWAGTELDARGGGVATIVLWGRKRREWGFHTRDGWIDWRTYVARAAPAGSLLDVVQEMNALRGLVSEALNGWDGLNACVELPPDWGERAERARITESKIATQAQALEFARYIAATAEARAKRRDHIRALRLAAYEFRKRDRV